MKPQISNQCYGFQQMETPTLLPRHLDRDGTKQIERMVRAALHQEGEAPPEPHALLCAACAHPVTDERLRIRVQGAHQHHCVNPAGVAFQVNCFQEAPGAIPIGEAESQHSWFPGHRWRYALCGGCGEHLGWHFSGISEFFGLIEGKVRPPGE